MTKETLKNNIMVAMRFYIDGSTMEILNKVLGSELRKVKVEEEETQLATADNTNEYIMELFEIRKVPKLSRKTAKAYRASMRQFISFCRKPLTKVDETDIEVYQRYCKEIRKNNNVSVNNQIRNVSAVYEWMCKTKIRLDNPCKGVEPYTEEKKPIDHMEAEHWEQLKTGCRHVRDRALIEFMRCTALRRGEIEGIRICDVDWRSGSIVANGHKTHQYRTVCLDGVAMKYLTVYLDARGVGYTSCEPLFTKKWRNRVEELKGDGLYSSIKKIAERSGIGKNIYPHLFRKTTGSNIVARGGSEDEAGEYLGHTKKSVTGRHYIYKPQNNVIKIFDSYVKQFS